MGDVSEVSYGYVSGLKVFLEGYVSFDGVYQVGLHNWDENWLFVCCMLLIVFD